EPELAHGEIEHLSPDEPELEHVRARFGRAGDRCPRHRGRCDPHVVPDRDSLRSEHLDEGPPDRTRAVLVELGAVDPTDVVRLENLGVEHGPDAIQLRKEARPWIVSTLEAWNASLQRSCSSISSTRPRSLPATIPTSCADVSSGTSRVSRTA